MRFYLVAATAALALVGCDTNKDKKPSAQEAGASIDKTVNAAGERIDDVGHELDRAGDKAEADARDASKDVKAVGREAADDVKAVGRDIKQGVEKGADKVDRAADAAGRELKKDK